MTTKWDFYKFGDLRGWMVPEGLRPEQLGGALMIRPATERAVSAETDAAEILTRDQIYPGKALELASPEGLGINAAEVDCVVLEVWNMSPETDGFVRWSAIGVDGAENRGRARFNMEPYHKEWQLIVCPIGDRWKGTVGRIWLNMSPLGRLGNIWIRTISVERRGPFAATPRPDICGENVVPRVSLPGIAQEDFADAFRVLDECTFADASINGMPGPIMGPGGGYGGNWWQLDTSLNTAGAKWTDQRFCENIIRGFMKVQAMNPDGRIDLWGSSTTRGGCGDISSLPAYFEAARDIAVRSGDPAFIAEVYDSVKKYLRWWLSPVKRDAVTGLISGIFEESFGGGHTSMPMTVAPLETNSLVAQGCLAAAELAELCGLTAEAAEHRAEFEALKTSINRYMWDDVRGAYFPYGIAEGRRRSNFTCSTFEMLSCGIAPPVRARRLIANLTDDSLFNWDTRPLTSIAKTEKEYCEAVGQYDGTAWYGDIWTIRNMAVVRGLEDAGEDELAARLNWETIKMFNRNYSEYLKPSDGSGHGVRRYGWSASQYIQAVIEHLFGVKYDGVRRVVTIRPRLPAELRGQTISLRGLIIPADGSPRLDVSVTVAADGRVAIAAGDEAEFKNAGITISC